VKIETLQGKASASVELATRRLNIWEGAVRSSKTTASLIRWMEYARTAPEGDLFMIGKTERTLTRNVLNPLSATLGRQRFTLNRGEGEGRIFGRRFYLAGANDERAADKIAGATAAGIYGDEVGRWPESFFTMALSRLSVTGASLFGTSNPEGPNHYLLTDYLDRAAVHLTGEGKIERPDGEGLLDLARFSFRLADNPTLSQAYVDALAAEFTGLWYLRLIEGRWVLAEGAVYDMFDPTGPQVVSELPTINRWWVAIDYGTVNPFVALLIGEGVDDRLYVAREWRWDSRAERKQLTDGQYAKRLGAWLDKQAGDLPGAGDPERVLVDPSAASFIAQLYEDGWRGVTGADNTVLDGLRDTASLLAGSRLKIHESCVGLIDEMPGYVWDPKAQKLGEDKPLKENDHGPDALRYGVRGTRNVWRRWDLRVAA